MRRLFPLLLTALLCLPLVSTREQMVLGPGWWKTPTSGTGFGVNTADKCTGAHISPFTTVPCTGPLTNQLANSVLKCWIHNEVPTGSAIAVTGVADTPTGLTWTHRATFTTTTSTSNAVSDLEEWTAVATAANPSTGTTPTATFASAPEAESMVCYAASGVNTSSPFDANANLGTATGTTGAASTPSTTASTTSTATLMDAATFQTSPTSCTTQSAGTGFTFIAQANEPSGTTFTSCLSVQYKTFMTAQTNVATPFGTSPIDHWGIMADAFH